MFKPEIDFTEAKELHLLKHLASKDRGILKECLHNSRFSVASDPLIRLLEVSDILQNPERNHVRNNFTSVFLMRLKNENTNPSLTADFVIRICEDICNASSNVYRKLKQDYSLTALHAYHLEDIIMCALVSSEKCKIDRLKDDLDSYHFSKLIKQYSQIETCASWTLEIKGRIDKLDNAGLSSEIEHDGPTAAFPG